MWMETLRHVAVVSAVVSVADLLFRLPAAASDETAAAGLCPRGLRVGRGACAGLEQKT